MYTQSVFKRDYSESRNPIRMKVVDLCGITATLPNTEPKALYHQRKTEIGDNRS